MGSPTDLKRALNLSEDSAESEAFCVTKWSFKMRRTFCWKGTCLMTQMRASSNCVPLPQHATLCHTHNHYHQHTLQKPPLQTTTFISIAPLLKQQRQQQQLEPTDSNNEAPLSFLQSNTTTTNQQIRK